MAAFCHPRPGGGRFSGPDRGAWYASLTLETAHAEVIYHRTAELAEIGVFETYVQERAYLADFIPWDETPKYLVRDRDAVYGEGCEATSTRAGHSGSTNRTALAVAKWHVERLIGSVRRPPSQS